MVASLVLALASSTPVPMGRGWGDFTPGHATAQATASVRIVSAARIRLHGPPERGLPPRKIAIVHVDGVARPVTLIEFE